MSEWEENMTNKGIARWYRDGVDLGKGTKDGEEQKEEEWSLS